MPSYDQTVHTMHNDAAGESYVRRFPIGAEPLPGAGVHFRVWAPQSLGVEVVCDAVPELSAGKQLDSEPDGYFSGFIAECHSGDLYHYRIDHADRLLPDPASRFQPSGPFGPSMVIDPAAFRWHDPNWRGVELDNQVIYEMHVGTFTPEGTWQAAARQLAELKHIGVTVLEIMPVNDFSGNFGWGYDGVNFFAPSRLYGTPDEFRGFVDEAHGCGLAVLLDVVYNHAGPTGNFLRGFSRDYFSDRYATEWGEAVNFDGANSAAVREFFLTNAAYWIAEFHLDGLRLDATQALHDASPRHILSEVVETVRRAASGRSTLVIGENEPQNSKLLRSAQENGYGLDALWNDGFHHSAMVALARESMQALLPDPTDPQVFASCKLDFRERDRHAEIYKLHRDLLRLRREIRRLLRNPPVVWMAQ